MPNYEYQCGSCEKEFTLIQSISEHDRSEPRCPQCLGEDVFQKYSLFFENMRKKH